VNFKRRRPTERKHDRSLTDGGLVVGTLITVDQHLVYAAHAQPHLSNGCLVVGTIIKSFLVLQPRPSAMRATPFGRRKFHQDEPQGYQVFFQMNECDLRR
jgi:hypothetical protein